MTSLLNLIESWRTCQREAKDDARTAWKHDQWGEAGRHDARAAVYERCANELQVYVSEAARKTKKELQRVKELAGAEPKPPRCPHDGGKCHHDCTDTCFRMEIGAELTKPWPGFPVPGNRPVLLNPLPDEMGEDGFTPEELAAHRRQGDCDP